MRACTFTEFKLPDPFLNAQSCHSAEPWHTETSASHTNRTSASSSSSSQRGWNFKLKQNCSPMSIMKRKIFLQIKLWTFSSGLEEVFLQHYMEQENLKTNHLKKDKANKRKKRKKEKPYYWIIAKRKCKKYHENFIMEPIYLNFKRSTVGQTKNRFWITNRSWLTC